MKKAIHIAILVMLAGSITSCEKIKSWFDVEGESTLSTDLYIDVTDPAMKSTNSFDFYEEAYIDPLEDDDIAEYEENIREIEATRIVATVASVSGKEEGMDVIFEKGTSISVKGSTLVEWTITEPWTVREGDKITLDDSETLKLYNKITEMLTNLEALTIIAKGTCNQTGVSVTLKVGIDIKYTANPL